MSNIGGVFTLITNNGIQDKLIMAADKLMDRITVISKERLVNLRKKYPNLTDDVIVKKDYEWMPTLANIEKTHIVFVNSSFKPYVSIAHEYSKTLPRGGVAKLGQSFNFTLPVNGEFVNDAVVHIRLDNFAAINPLNKVRWVEFLGHRIMKNVRFKMGQVTLDEYTADRYNINWQFKVPQHKEISYMRSIGQEVPALGYVTSDPSIDDVREYRWVGTGPQTFKARQPAIDLWIPLLFWFKDIHSALPNFLFPYGQTDIEIDLEDESKLTSYANYAGLPVGTDMYTVPVVTQCELFVNHIYIDPAIHKIFMKRFGYQLIRVSRTHKIQNLKNPEDSILLHKIKWPVECMYVAFRPAANLAFSQQWHRNTAITAVDHAVPVVTTGNTIRVNNIQFYEEKPIVETLGLRLHDITIYQDLPPVFYNSYIPTQYGQNIKAPRDLGWNMMNFNFQPGEYQPSGYINVSQGREFYLRYKSALDPVTNEYYIRQNNPIELIVVADCINFLLVKDNTAVLRFST
jgi:hypothetical protein